MRLANGYLMGYQIGICVARSSKRKDKTEKSNAMCLLNIQACLNVEQWMVSYSIQMLHVKSTLERVFYPMPFFNIVIYLILSRIKGLSNFPT